MSLHTEATHHTLWNMSDRGIPRSFRTMEGFGVHTFRLVNDERETVLVKFHWKPAAGRALADLGGGADRRRRRPRLPPPRPVRRDRGRRLPRVGAGRAGLPGHAGADVRGHRPARPHQARPGGAGPGAADRQAGAERQPAELLRRGRAGRVLHRARRSGHRVHQRPAAAGPQLLLPGHPDHPARRAELRRRSRSTGRTCRSTTTTATGSCSRPSRRRRALPAQLGRRREPVAGGLGRRRGT